MTDRELLEAAAKVAGVEAEYLTELMCLGGDWSEVTGLFLPDDMGWWNPLTEDDDALRLAVSLDLLFDPETSRLHSEELASGKAPMEATRRAIVRAAAAMKPAHRAAP